MRRTGSHASTRVEEAYSHANDTALQVAEMKRRFEAKGVEFAGEAPTNKEIAAHREVTSGAETCVEPARSDDDPSTRVEGQPSASLSFIFEMETIHDTSGAQAKQKEDDADGIDASNIITGKRRRAAASSPAPVAKAKKNSPMKQGVDEDSEEEFTF